MDSLKASSEPSKKAGTESDPNGHSHGVENNFKSSSEGMEAMMKPFMGFSKLFSARNSPSRDERRVKIDFLQNGEELPEGTVESISAGGGKAPGHHEGGGLTVKVNEKIEPRKATSSQQKPRKTLNFYFTW